MFTQSLLIALSLIGFANGTPWRYGIVSYDCSPHVEMPEEYCLFTEGEEHKVVLASKNRKPDQNFGDCVVRTKRMCPVSDLSITQTYTKPKADEINGHTFIFRTSQQVTEVDAEPFYKIYNNLHPQLQRIAVLVKHKAPSHMYGRVREISVQDAISRSQPHGGSELHIEDYNNKTGLTISTTDVLHPRAITLTEFKVVLDVEDVSQVTQVTLQLHVGWASSELAL